MAFLFYCIKHHNQIGFILCLELIISVFMSETTVMSTFHSSFYFGFFFFKSVFTKISILLVFSKYFFDPIESLFFDSFISPFIFITFFCFELILYLLICSICIFSNVSRYSHKTLKESTWVYSTNFKRYYFHYCLNLSVS